MRVNSTIMSSNPEISAEQAREILAKILEAIELPENSVKLGEAKDNAGNDMIKMMQYVFPVVMQIQMDVIKSFGFQENREGLIQFGYLIRSLEATDEEVARLHAQVRSHFLPPVSINTEPSS